MSRSAAASHGRASPTLNRTIRIGDDTIIGVSYWELRQRIGREKASDLAERFWRAYPPITRRPLSPQAQQAGGPWPAPRQG